MEKYKYLLKNVGIMTLASFGTKILSFLMVPLYTNILSTEAYGTYDIYQTTLFLLVPVLQCCHSNRCKDTNCRYPEANALHERNNHGLGNLCAK